MSSERLFVAVWPTPPVVRLLEELPRSSDPRLRWSTPDQWHVTLRFFGSVGDEERPALDLAWRGIDLDLDGPVEAVLGPATARLGPGIVQVPVDGLEDLATRVVGATAEVGAAPDARPFRGHITLARSRHRRMDLRRMVGTPVAARWTVTEVTLVRSNTAGSTSHYEVVDRRPVG